MAKTENPVLLTLWLTAAVGALNWGLVEVFDVNLVTELLPTELVGPVYIAIGAIGAIDILETFEIVDITPNE